MSDDRIELLSPFTDPGYEHQFCPHDAILADNCVTCLRRMYSELFVAAKLMAKTFRNRNYTSLAQACRYLHEQHPKHCAGRHDPFDALRPCSCSLNQLISALRNGQAALDKVIRDARKHAPKTAERQAP